MKIILMIGSMMLLSGCAAMIPGLTQAIDDAVTDEAINITVDKASMQKETDIDILVQIRNKDLPAAPPVINVHQTN